MKKDYFGVGVSYDYNNITITIGEGAMGISKIAASGIPIGGSQEFNRIKNQTPAALKVYGNDGTYDFNAMGTILNNELTKNCKGSISGITTGGSSYSKTVIIHDGVGDGKTRLKLN